VAFEGRSELGLRDYVRVLNRRRNVVIAAVAAVMGIALTAALVKTPVYEGKVRVLLKAPSSESLFDARTGERLDASRAVDTDLLVLKSEAIRAAVREQVDEAPKVSATSVGQTDVIEIRARHEDPERAAAITNAYATAYIDFRRSQAVEELLAAAGQIGDKISELQAQIDVAQGQQQAALIEQQALFKQRLDQLQVDAALKTGGAQLITPAAVPSEPVEPRPLRTAVFALAVGLLLGVGLAFLLDHLDDSVKTKDDLERSSGLAVVGLIPAAATWKATEEPRVLSVEEPTSPAAEAYRTLRTSVQFLGIERALGTLQVTSANAQEGKTTTLANLGVALARAGQPVVLVCCDLRRPRIHDFFGLSDKVGFTSVLLGDVPLWSAIQEVPGVDRLSLLAAGPLPPNPSELLATDRTAEVLGPLQAEGNLVLIDSPPVLPVTDALVLSRRVDATLLVCAAGRTSRKDVARAVELLGQVDAPLVGAVLNGVTAGGSYGYGYQYYRKEEAEKDEAEEQAGDRQREPTR
jgi:succinoglycan biosynthesis transport protein ExoP